MTCGSWMYLFELTPWYKKPAQVFIDFASETNGSIITQRRWFNGKWSRSMNKSIGWMHSLILDAKRIIDPGNNKTNHAI